MLGLAHMAANLGSATAWAPLAAARNGLVLACALAGATPVDSPFFDMHIVLTEFGSVDLRGLSSTERATALIGLAHPEVRNGLMASDGRACRVRRVLRAGQPASDQRDLINGLFDCHRSRVLVVAIAAHIPSPEIGAGYFQEIHPEQLFGECSSYCELVSNPAQMPRVLEIAVRRAVAE